jgi:hypothetical protein
MKLSSEQWGWLIVAGIMFSCFGAPRAENASSCRLRIEKSGESPWPAVAGIVQVWPSIANGGRFNVSTADGKRVHSQLIWSAAGRH